MWLRAGMVALLSCWAAAPQVMDGELRLSVRDPAGDAVPARILLTGRSPAFRAEATADSAGFARLSRLPAGMYVLHVTHAGFAEFSGPVEIRSAVPQEKAIRLSLGAIPSVLTVKDAAPLLDRSQPGVIVRAGREQLEEMAGTALGRGVIDVISTMPGWLLEANAVLHPRGSEYDTQYVVDGMPLYDNRSIAFAPAFENSELEAVNVLTGGIPAEYGRRLGGVVALDTRRIGAPGAATEISLQSGSFGTTSGSFGRQHRGERAGVSFGAFAGRTDRYLDPPSVRNFSNQATAAGAYGRVELDLGKSDRVSLSVRSNRTSFQAPNDPVQQAAGQRQDRRTAETSGRVQYHHVFSSRVLASVHGMLRDLDARLWSNPFSTPVYVDQQRGFREGAVLANLSFAGERNTLKLGGDLRVNAARERFRFAEPDELLSWRIDFAGRRRGVESSLFLQDHFRAGHFSAAAGVRVDHYRFLIRDTALSPRLAASYYIPRAALLLRAAYDRVFQPPPAENLLFSSAAATFDLHDVRGAIPVPASTGNFFEAGLRKTLGNRLRLDITHFWRTFRNYPDDDVFLNTGLSFPIAFDTARVEGTEVRLELPRWRRVSSFVSYANMLGTATSPVTGGLFLEGGEAEELRNAVRRFPISQDQRNTAAAYLRLEPWNRLWFASAWRYGSGLPVELEDDDHGGRQQRPPIDPAIVERVNFERGRVRPNLSLDFSAGLRMWERAGRTVVLQADVRNITGRLNLINFSGLFSGTALAPGRQVTLQLRSRF